MGAIEEEFKIQATANTNRHVINHQCLSSALGVIRISKKTEFTLECLMSNEDT
jgi:hypothetical protein